MVGAEELNEAGEVERPILLRAEALDFRSPCADDGRPGGLESLAGTLTLAGGADDDQVLPASSASN